MKKLIKRLMLLGLMTPFLVACSTEEVTAEKSALGSSGSETKFNDILAADLVGTWNLTAMNSDMPVDLNFDQTTNTNILEETNCFNQMFFRFDGNGNITAGWAKLDFGKDGSKFDCGYGEYSASFEVEGNELTVYFQADVIKVSETKTVALSNDGENEYLHISLEDYEVDAYVNDPGNTVASQVGRVEMTFKKQ